MWSLLNYSKKHAITRYLKALPSALANGYGKSRYYTPMQVFKMIEKEGLSKRFTLYALVIFSSKELVSEYYEQMNSSESIQGVYDEMSEILLDNKNKFSVSDVNLFFASEAKQSNGESVVTPENIEEYKGHLKTGIDIPTKLTSEQVILATTEELSKHDSLTDFDSGASDGG